MFQDESLIEAEAFKEPSYRMVYYKDWQEMIRIWCGKHTTYTRKWLDSSSYIWYNAFEENQML